MRKIKFLLPAFIAMLTAVSFTACNHSDDNEPTSNYERYQRAVDATVSSQKKHDKALLLVVALAMKVPTSWK